MKSIIAGTQRTPFLPLAASLTLSVWLGGCAITAKEPPGGGHAGTLPVQYAGWFTSGPQANINGSDWGTINRAQDRIEEGRYEEAIAYLQPLMDRYVPTAFYEMAKLYEQGLGVEKDPSEAARLYGLAIEKSSSVRGHASLNLAQLYLDDGGVERNDVLAYYLLWQAVEADLNRTAEIELAELLSEGGEGVEADPALAIQLYEQAASQGKAPALKALAEAHAPGGWLWEDAAQSIAYAQRYANRLEANAGQGDVGAMLQLASAYSQDGLLGDQPDRRIQWLQQAAQAGDLDALARAGHEMTKAGEYRQGIALLEDAARQGHVGAMTYLGQALLEPEHTGRLEQNRAERWLNEAIQAGSVDALVVLGRALVNGQADLDDLPRGMGLLEQAAESNHPLALAQLGALLMNDERVTSQPYIAVSYLNRAHELGHPWATQQLGVAYLESRGVLRDLERAEELLHSAAEQGQAGATRILGEAYLEGLLNGNPSQGIRLLTQAAEQGDSYAMILLGRAYQKGSGVSRDLNEAIHWLTRARDAGHESAAAALTYVQRDLGAGGNINALIAAAKGGHPGAMADLGRAYLDGKGVERNHIQAEKWLEQAHQAGHAGASASLGRMYLDRGDSARGIDYLNTAASRGHDAARADLGEAYMTGNHAEQDVERGLELLISAAESGSPNAAFTLGDAYQHGKGVGKDAVLAERWYQQAGDAGAIHARAALGIAFISGEGAIAQDVQRGHELLLNVAEQGHLGAQAFLGREYLRGENIEKDPERGVNYLYEAASQGYRSARLSLAEAYLSARGYANVNQEQAMLWLNELLDSEEQIALETLRQLILEEVNVAASGRQM
ncbi:tetratricopeptide repeat protein [Vreelandella neptunia]|uniref:SEL1-like repeat protein n=1 Tax=Vreelandella neptunia TaxID=115551 RepID=UPI00315B399E